MTLTDPQKAEVFSRLDALSGPTIGVAVSGGGDSMALTALACSWAKQSGKRIAAVTVDHGLRPESAGEAERVASFCAELGISHDTLIWTGWDGSGNLQDMARKARLRLIGRWAEDMSITHVATGHTHDDQAETILMRLLRGSGVDGLAGMDDRRQHGLLMWHRPLLDTSRSALRDYLAAEGLPWVDDPSNDDDAFDRVKARQALAALESLGITREGLVETGSRMRRAKIALQSATDGLAKSASRIDHGDVVLDWALLTKAPQEIRNRLVAKCLMWVSNEIYRPRAKALESCVSAMEAGKTTVLSGCHISAEGSSRRITREFAAARLSVSDTGALWDNRWQIDGPEKGEVRALGEGIRDCPDWRDSGLPRTSLLSSPAVWKGNRLIAAPLAGFGRGWKAKLVTPNLF